MTVLVAISSAWIWDLLVHAQHDGVLRRVQVYLTAFGVMAGDSRLAF